MSFPARDQMRALMVSMPVEVLVLHRDALSELLDGYDAEMVSRNLWRGRFLSFFMLVSAVSFVWIGWTTESTTTAFIYGAAGALWVHSFLTTIVSTEKQRIESDELFNNISTDVADLTAEIQKREGVKS